MTISQLSNMLEGSLVSIELTILSVCVGIFFAFFIAIMRISESKVLQKIAWIYIWIIRGTPLLLQIMVVYFAIPIMAKDLLGISLALPQFTSAVIALTMNVAAYSAEIIRAGIESIDKGQMEASKALGMNRRQAMIKVIIPQTIKRVIPSFCSEFTMILKDSSLVSVIGMSELMKVSKQFAASGAWGFYFYAGAIYLALTTVISVVFDKLEKRAGIYE